MTKDEFAQRILAMTDVLYRIAWSQLRQQADREDAVQETIRRAWEKQASLRDERYMQTWVNRILLNVCRSQQRRAQRMLPTEDVPIIQADTQQSTPLLDALFTLEEKFRLPLQLRYVEGYSVAEVARIYDGYGVYLVVDVTPKSPNVFLIPYHNADLDDPAGDVVSSFPDDVTLEEHIMALGYGHIYRVDITTGLAGFFSRNNEAE